MMTRLEETPVVWCTGSNAVDALGLSGLHRIRGQLEFLTPIAGLNHAICFGHYLLPGENTLVLARVTTTAILIPRFARIRRRCLSNWPEPHCLVCRCTAPEDGQVFGLRRGIGCLCLVQMPKDISGAVWPTVPECLTGPFLGAFLADCMEEVPGVLPSVYVDRLRVGRFKS